MKITYELLQEKRACSDGLQWFQENFPNGCELCDKTIAEIENAPTDFVWWFYNNIQQDKRLYKLCGVSRSFGILNSYGVDCAMFLADKPRTYSIFGREVRESRFNEVQSELYAKLNGWRPTFNNIKALYLKHGSDWKLTPVHNAEELSIKEAWSDMPQEAVAYVKSLTEFDAEMFAKITGIEV